MSILYDLLAHAIVAFIVTPVVVMSLNALLLHRPVLLTFGYFLVSAVIGSVLYIWLGLNDWLISLVAAVMQYHGIRRFLLMALILRSDELSAPYDIYMTYLIPLLYVGTLVGMCVLNSIEICTYPENTCVSLLQQIFAGA